MIDTVIFDLNGTLLADSYPLYDFYSGLCEREGLRAPWNQNGIDGFQNWKGWVSADWRVNVKRMELTSSEESIWKAYYEHVDRMEIPGLVKGIKRIICKQAPYKMAILSANEKRNIVPVLEAHGLDDGRFEGVYGNDCLLTAKPHPAALKDTMLEIDADPSKTVYVGDTREDMVFANRNGVRSVGVTWGINSRGRLQKGGPRVIANKPEELQEILRKL